jgi:signal peptidase II
MRRRLLVVVGILVACVGCDHAAKQLATGALDAAAVSLVGDAVRFDLVHNTGAFLSLGEDLPRALRAPLLMGFVPLALAGFCLLALRSSLVGGWRLVGLGLVAGGGVGNWLDRVLHDGAVTDFVSLGLGSLRTGIFNLADLFIVAGVALLLLGRGSKDVERRPTGACD